MILFVDEVKPRGLGAIITSKRKAEFVLAVNNLKIEQIIYETPSHMENSTSLLHMGRFIVVINIKRDLSFLQISFMNYEIDLDKNFNAFADTFSPKFVAEFYRLKEIIKSKTEEELNRIELSEDDLEFEIAYRNYIVYQNQQK